MILRSILPFCFFLCFFPLTTLHAEADLSKKNLMEVTAVIRANAINPQEYTYPTYYEFSDDGIFLNITSHQGKPTMVLMTRDTVTQNDPTLRNMYQKLITRHTNINIPKDFIGFNMTVAMENRSSHCGSQILMGNGVGLKKILAEGSRPGAFFPDALNTPLDDGLYHATFTDPMSKVIPRTHIILHQDSNAPGGTVVYIFLHSYPAGAIRGGYAVIHNDFVRELVISSRMSQHVSDIIRTRMGLATTGSIHIQGSTP